MGGVVGCNWGGTSASHWIDRDSILSDDETRIYVDEYDEKTAGKSAEEQKKEYDKYVEHITWWDAEAKKIWAVRPDASWDELIDKLGPNQWPGPVCMYTPFRPAGLYECMISRIMPYTLRGVIYYQGESDDHRPEAYYKLFSILIRKWREYFEDPELPFILLDFTTHWKLCDCVISDSFYGSCQLTDYLFRKGHRKIAFVGTVLSTGSITDRYLGYLKSMMEHHIQVPEEWIIPDRDTETGDVDRDRFFPLPDDMPTAFVCNSDLTAAHLCRKLAIMGIRCPEDVSITGFDNFIYPGVDEGQFTTYEVDTKAMARKAVHNLIHKLNGEYYRRWIIVVTGRLIKHGSVRALEESEEG